MRKVLRGREDYLQPSSPAVAATASALQHVVRAICVDCESVRTSPFPRGARACVYMRVFYRRGVLAFAKTYGHTYTTPYPTRSARLQLSYLLKPAALVLGEGGERQRERRERERIQSGAEDGKSDSN